MQIVTYSWLQHNDGLPNAPILQIPKYTCPIPTGDNEQNTINFSSKIIAFEHTSHLVTTWNLV